MSIKYHIRDATKPIGAGTKIIVQVCKDIVIEELLNHGVQVTVYDLPH